MRWDDHNRLLQVFKLFLLLLGHERVQPPCYFEAPEQVQEVADDQERRHDELARPRLVAGEEHWIKSPQVVQAKAVDKHPEKNEGEGQEGTVH